MSERETLKESTCLFTTTTIEASVDWKDAMSQRTMQIQLRKRRKDAPRNMKNPERRSRKEEEIGRRQSDEEAA